MAIMMVFMMVVMAYPVYHFSYSGSNENNNIDCSLDANQYLLPPYSTARDLGLLVWNDADAVAC